MSFSEPFIRLQRSGGVRGQGSPRFTSQLFWWMPRSENPSPRLFRAGFIKADSLHAGIRAPEPTLSRGERVGPAPLYVLRPCLASAHPPHLQRRGCSPGLVALRPMSTHPTDLHSRRSATGRGRTSRWERVARTRSALNLLIRAPFALRPSPLTPLPSAFSLLTSHELL